MRLASPPNEASEEERFPFLFRTNCGIEIKLVNKTPYTVLFNTVSQKEVGKYPYTDFRAPHFPNNKVGK
jgi:hypothetical protein